MNAFGLHTYFAMRKRGSRPAVAWLWAIAAHNRAESKA